jgi:hypothetical protein
MIINFRNSFETEAFINYLKMCMNFEFSAVSMVKFKGNVLHTGLLVFSQAV